MSFPPVLRVPPRPPSLSSLLSVLEEISAERARQVALWPDCEHLPDGTGGGGRETYETIARNSCDRAYREKRLTHAHVFEEECAEVLAETDPARLRVELVQVMAVCAKWIADLDSRGARVQVDLGARVAAIGKGLRGGNSDPNRCVCAERETGANADTPHVHYRDDPPYACARCECTAYVPAIEGTP